MKCYLKCYYGYKNRGDELLFFGVVSYIVEHYSPTKLYIEVWDKVFFRQWLDQNKQYLPNNVPEITIVAINETNNYDLRQAMYFFGWWELITDEILYQDSTSKKAADSAKKETPSDTDSSHIDTDVSLSFEHLQQTQDVAPTTPPFLDKLLKKSSDWLLQFASRFFARAWRNYLIRYFADISSWNFVLLWGFSLPQKITTRYLYTYMLPKAQKIVCRDPDSYALVTKYSPKNAVLFQDFAVSTLHDFVAQSKETSIQILLEDTMTVSLASDQYILINCHKKVWNDVVRQQIQTFVQTYPQAIPIFFPGDIEHDHPMYQELKKSIPSLLLYDWTCQTLSTTLHLFWYAHASIWARLHFLLPLQEMGKFFIPLVYAEKIKKLIRIARSHTYISYDDVVVLSAKDANRTSRIRMSTWCSYVYICATTHDTINPQLLSQVQNEVACEMLVWEQESFQEYIVATIVEHFLQFAVWSAVLVWDILARPSSILVQKWYSIQHQPSLASST